MANKCEHDPNLKGTTLIRNLKHKMVNPQTFDFFCPCCKKIFKFGKDASGKYYEVINNFSLDK